MFDLEAQFFNVFRKFSAIAGREASLKWLEIYFQTFSREDWEPFEKFRAFPLYLRNENRSKRLEKAWLVDLALWEWTEFVTLYSPASEVNEARSLSAGEFVLNPTAQILRLDWDFVSWQGEGVPEENKTMAFIYRAHESDGWKLRSRSADWSSAAIVDVLLENGRVSESELIREIEQTQGTGHTAAWLEKLSELCEAGLVLRRL
jgi:hypothetical protein